MSTQEKIEKMLKKAEVILAAGGEKRVAKQHESGKMTARERIAALLDEGSFVELDRFVRHRCYNFGQEKKELPGEGVTTGYGTIVAEGKETREFNGRPYLMEESITGDFAIVKGWKADHFGNVIYRHTAQNFNPLAATAGKITVVEVEEIVEPGELDPAQIHTPGIYVDRIICGTFEKRIEQRTVRK